MIFINILLKVSRPDIFKNRYRIDSNRFKFRNYSAPGNYFLPLNVKDSVHTLGKVVDDEMVLSKCGKIVHDELVKISEYHPLANPDVSVIMPNHVHMIISIANHNNDAKNPKHWKKE